ncbi:site-specific integrase [Streptomyces microflavus]|uniref:integrase n=1 Tax=Streptomyces microflavus TaxID=1919 RepID=UPI00364D1494
MNPHQHPGAARRDAEPDEDVPLGGLIVPAAAGPLADAAAYTPDVLAKLQELEQRSKEHEQNLRPQNTVDGYAVDWAHWERFTALLGLPITAITPGSLTAFVEWLWWEPGWKPGTCTAPSTIDRRLSGVVVTGRSRYNLLLSKTVASRARAVLRAKVRELEKGEEVRGRGPAPAFTVPQLRAAVAAAPDTLLGLRNRAVVTLSFALMAREHESAFLRLRDLVDHENGLIVDVRVSKVKPRKSKVPQGTRPSTCPVRTWRAWKKAAGLADPDGYAFRALHPRWHTVTDKGLDPETIGDIITAMGAGADLDVRHTGHSTRRGGADAARRAGADRKAIAAHGGWTDNSKALEAYFDDGEGWEDNAMNGVL